MKVVLAVAMLVFVSQAHGYSSGRDVSVDANGEATKVCQDCLNFFKDIQEMVASENMSAQVEELLNQMVCSNMGELQGVCKDLVHQYVPIILSYIAGMEDPRQVCGLMGLCTQKVLKLVTMPVHRKLGDEKCDICKNAVNELKDIVRNQQYQGLIKGFIEDNICPLLGSLAAECKQEVEVYASMVFALLENELDPVVVCQTLGFCSQTKMVSLTRIGLSSSATKVKVFKPQKKVADEKCVLCETAIKMLIDQLGTNKTKEAIEAALDQVCNLLPASIKQQCLQFVDEYGPLVVKLLLEDLDPEQVCTELGLCTSVKKVTEPAPACVLCEFVMDEVDKLLANNKSQANVEAALKKVCGIMPSTISAECKNFVVAYGPTIINLLVKDLDPKEVCKTLRFCTSNKAISALKKTHPRVEKKYSASAQCILCEFVMKQLDSILSKNATKEEIEEALDKVCSLLPSTISQECTNFVNQYAAVIINLLLNNLDPQQICKTIGLCTNDLKATHPQLERKFSASPQCVLCEFVMKQLDTMLSDNATEVEIRRALDKVCSVLPSTITDECTTFVNTYAPAVIQLLVQELDPEEVCTVLGLCSGPSVIKATPLKKFRGQECQYCVIVLNYVDELLKENFTTQDVEMVLEKVCNFLGGQVGEECKQLVDQYTPEIINLIATDLNPRQICEELSMCNATQKAVELKDNKLYFKSNQLGRDKCTYGPAYWCSSKEIAAHCGAVEHCVKHVWN